jgi:hypothetical protein
VRNGKIVAQVEVQRVQDRLETAGGDHAHRQAVHLLADRVVFLAELQQLAHFAFELLVLVAQREHLAFGDRDRPPTMRVRNDHVGHQFRVLFEKLRIDPAGTARLRLDFIVRFLP